MSLGVRKWSFCHLDSEYTDQSAYYRSLSWEPHFLLFCGIGYSWLISVALRSVCVTCRLIWSYTFHEWHKHHLCMTRLMCNLSLLFHFCGTEPWLSRSSIICIVLDTPSMFELIEDPITFSLIVKISNINDISKNYWNTWCARVTYM